MLTSEGTELKNPLFCTRTVGCKDRSSGSALLGQAAVLWSSPWGCWEQSNDLRPHLQHQLRTRGTKGLRLFIATVTPPRTRSKGPTQSHTEIWLE